MAGQLDRINQHQAIAMANDDKKGKATPAKTDTPAGNKTSSGPDASPGPDASKAEAGTTAGASPASYSRGEGQKPVTQAYKDNWNAIFGKKEKR